MPGFLAQRMKPLPGGTLDTVISYMDGQIRPIAKPLARATCPQRQVRHIMNIDISMTHSNIRPASNTLRF